VNKNRPSTLDLVASAAGVSRATVSRVVNGNDNVSPQTRELVQKQLRKLDYQPNILARKLAGGRGNLIALVLEESSEEFFVNPFWRSVVEGFMGVCQENKRNPMLFFHSKEESDQELINLLVEAHVDGVAIFGWHRDIRILDQKIPDDMAVVFGGNQGRSTRFSFVGVDNFKGGKLATEHLIKKGCRRILHLTGSLDVLSARERVDGYKDALSEAGIKYDPKLIIAGDYTALTAHKVMKRIIKSKLSFDGVFAGNDLSAVAVIEELKSAGITVPGKVKVIGYDGSSIAESHSPTISTIAQTPQLLGQKVAEKLMQSLEGHDLENEEIELRLIARQSS
jgi:DNA-binding LacI/PurR family transcriptional regulator